MSGNYELNWWVLLDLDYSATFDKQVLDEKIKEYAIGYCESEKIKYRPKTDSYAIMFEKNSETFWFHMSKEHFEEE